MIERIANKLGYYKLKDNTPKEQVAPKGKVLVDEQALLGVLAMVKLIKEEKGELHSSVQDMKRAAKRVADAESMIHDALVDIQAHAHKLESANEFLSDVDREVEA